LSKARALLAPGGEIVIGDCFRSETYQADPLFSTVGGGHGIAKFHAVLAQQPLRVVSTEDITQAVAPSIDLEQQLFNVLGTGIIGMNGELQRKRPFQHKLMMVVLHLFVPARKRARLSQRLFEQHRTAARFVANNRYLLIRLAQEAPKANA
jgi:MPBQ/MSBQ methyltransferase